MANIARIIKLSTVVERAALSATSSYRGITAGRFLKQLKLGKRSSAWDEGAVEGWLRFRQLEAKAEVRFDMALYPSPFADDLRGLFDRPLIAHVNLDNPVQIDIARKSGVALMKKIRDIVSKGGKNAVSDSSQPERLLTDGYSSGEYCDYLEQADGTWRALERDGTATDDAWSKTWKSIWKKSWARVDKTNLCDLEFLRMYLLDALGSWEYARAARALDNKTQAKNQRS